MGCDPGPLIARNQDSVHGNHTQFDLRVLGALCLYVETDLVAIVAHVSTDRPQGHPERMVPHETSPRHDLNQ